MRDKLVIKKSVEGTVARLYYELILEGIVVVIVVFKGGSELAVVEVSSVVFGEEQLQDR